MEMTVRVRTRGGAERRAGPPDAPADGGSAGVLSDSLRRDMARRRGSNRANEAVLGPFEVRLGTKLPTRIEI